MATTFDNERNIERARGDTNPQVETEPLLQPRMAESWKIAVMAVIGIAALGSLAWWWTARTYEQTARVETSYSRDVVGTSGTLPGTPVGQGETAFIRVLPGGAMFVVPRGSAEDRLSMYLAAPASRPVTVAFDRIAFDAGTAILVPSSRDQIANIAALLRAYPKARATIVGYADDGGDGNADLALSRARAQEIATWLSRNGVALQRIRAEGAGRSAPGDARPHDEAPARASLVVVVK
jgi:outer membrane protein OmpA-like peptidoglycan-associated protein